MKAIVKVFKVQGHNKTTHKLGSLVEPKDFPSGVFQHLINTKHIELIEEKQTELVEEKPNKEKKEKK